MGLVSEPALLRSKRAKALEYLHEADLQFSAVLSEIVRQSFQTMDPTCSALFLWACEVCGGDSESALPVAVSIECLHRFVVLHQYLGCESSAGYASAADKWGLAQTLNAGDAFHAVGLRLLGADTTHPDRALKAAAMLTETLLHWIERCSRTSVARHPEAREPAAWIRKAHAAPEAIFFGASLQAGAILAAADAPLASAFRRAGRFLGVAKQAAVAEGVANAALARKYADKAVAVVERSAIERSHRLAFKEVAYHLASAASE